MIVLGISAFYHDSAAAIVRDGEIVAAAQEERFTRRKFDRRFPVSAIRYCLAESALRLRELDAIVFYEKPARKIERVVSEYMAHGPRGWSRAPNPARTMSVARESASRRPLG